MGTRTDRAATTGAMLAYPPIPNTAAASRTIGRLVATERSATNGAAADRSDTSRLNGAAATPWKR